MECPVCYEEISSTISCSYCRNQVCKSCIRNCFKHSSNLNCIICRKEFVLHVLIEVFRVDDHVEPLQEGSDDYAAALKVLTAHKMRMGDRASDRSTRDRVRNVERTIARAGTSEINLERIREWEERIRERNRSWEQAMETSMSVE